MLPWDYGVRNLLRRPLRTLLTLAALSIVVLLVLVVVGFIRGLERSLAISGDDHVALVFSVNSGDSIENSSIPASTPALLTSSLARIQNKFGVWAVSPELYLGTRITIGGQTEAGLGLVRGVEHNVPLVRRQVQLDQGRWPNEGEVLVGRLVAAKLGVADEELEIGRTIEFEGRIWRVCGTFAAGGAAPESEVWCRLADLQQATKRQDISLAALLLTDSAAAAEVQLFCKERTDLELTGLLESEYYAGLQRHYRPLKWLAWMVVWLVSGAGVFVGLNLMYGAVAGRTRELAALRAIGYRRRAILLSLVQEGVLLAALSSLISGTLAIYLINGLAVRFTMGAFTLSIDGVAVVIGCLVGLMLGAIGALPPALKALRMPVAAGLKAI